MKIILSGKPTWTDVLVNKRFSTGDIPSLGFGKYLMNSAASVIDVSFGGSDECPGYLLILNLYTALPRSVIPTIAHFFLIYGINGSIIQPPSSKQYLNVTPRSLKC